MAGFGTPRGRVNKDWTGQERTRRDRATDRRQERAWQGRRERDIILTEEHQNELRFSHGVEQTTPHRTVESTQLNCGTTQPIHGTRHGRPGQVLTQISHLYSFIYLLFIYIKSPSSSNRKRALGSPTSTKKKKKKNKYCTQIHIKINGRDIQHLEMKLVK